MIDLKGFRRLIAPLEKKIYLLIGRAILASINNTETTQKAQITALANETITDIERLQEYGFESYPFSNAEALALFINGKRDQGVIICIADRRYRPIYLAEGEICIYTDEDKLTDNQRIHLKNNQIIDILAKILNITMATNINIVSPITNITGNIVMTGNYNLTGNIVQTGNINVTGNIEASLEVKGSSVTDGNVTTPTMNDMRTTYNSHTHPGGGVPNPQM